MFRAWAILREAAYIYSGGDTETIRQRVIDFRRKWTPVEPKAVRCFLKNFNLTLNYLRVPFPRKYMICTTNLLERFFREFRNRTDEIGSVDTDLRSQHPQVRLRSARRRASLLKIGSTEATLLHKARWKHCST